MKKIYTVLFACLLAGCAADEVIPEMTPTELYNKGISRFEKTDYEGAASYFDEVDRQHPYSEWAPRAQIMAAYSFYKKNQYDDALLTLERFIQLHPGNTNTPYAYYLKGLCYYEQMSDIGREQQMSREAKQTFLDLIARYPKSSYAVDAQAKLQMIENQLAGKEMDVGRYYLKQKDYLAAMNRFIAVIDRFSHTEQLNEANYRLAVCYMALGMKKNARHIADIQNNRFPNTLWTKETDQLIQKYQ